MFKEWGAKNKTQLTKYVKNILNKDFSKSLDLLRESGVLFSTTPDKIKVKTYDTNYVTVEISSGKYNFSGKL